MRKSLVFYLIILSFTFFHCFIPPNSKRELQETNLGNEIPTSITINIKYHQSTVYVGEDGNINFKTDFKDENTNYFNSLDIEEKTLVYAYIYDYHDSKGYGAKCRLWKPINDNLYLLCNIISSISSYYYYLKSYSISYNNSTIYIQTPTSSVFHLTKISSKMTMLYASQQTISIERDKKSYELQFKIGEYNNEVLYLSSNNAIIYLKKCSIIKNNLICEFEKEDMEEVLQYNNQKFDVYAIHGSSGVYKMELVYNITIIDNLWQKKDLYIKITRLLQNYINTNNYIAYETNVTSTSNIISGKFDIQTEKNENINCYMKKAGDDPLLILCKWSYSSENELGRITYISNISNSNFKYNFIILTQYNNETFRASNSRATLLFSYPKILDFNLEENFTINYVFDSNYNYERSIRLIPYNKKLTCKNSINDYILSCDVNRRYFGNEKREYYYTYHLIYNVIYSIYYEDSPIQVIIPDDNKIFLKIRSDVNKIIVGEKGTIYLVTDFIDNETNIFDPSSIEDWNFTMLLYGQYNNYYTYCRFFKQNNNKNISLLCNLNKIINYETKISLQEIEINYNDHKIIIYSDGEFDFTQLNYTVPFLYSDEQTINVNQQKQEFTVSFKIVKYNNEDLFLYGMPQCFAKFDGCDISGNTLNCRISKQKLEEILTLNNLQFTVFAVNDNAGIILLNFTGTININYNVVNKENIYVGITKILNNGRDNLPIVFETNITSIPSLHSYYFQDKDEYNNYNGYCYFKKTKMYNLLLFCKYYSNYGFYKRFRNEVILDSIHYKFIFRIQPNDTSIYIYSSNDNKYSIYLADPEELNFESQNSISIRFFTNSPEYINRLGLFYYYSYSYSDLNYLNCVNLNLMKRCQVPISYFIRQNYKENTYSYLYHYFNEYRSSFAIDYEIPPIKVTLPNKMIIINIEPDENSDTKVICKNPKMFLFTDYYDNENIFDSYGNEMYFMNNITIKVNYKTFDYEIYCRFWKRKNKNLIIICKSSETLDISGDLSAQGYLGDVAFDYNDFRIIINSNTILSLQILNRNCPFLYADEQVINIKENEYFYQLNFKKDEYNNQPLLLSNINLNYIELNCSEVDNNLICEVEKEKLLEQNNGERFKVYYYEAKYGFQEFSLILDITVNSEIPKENIYVNITRLLESNKDVNNFVTYQTNVTFISNIISDYFLINSKRLITCFFKKSEKSYLLLLLCRWPVAGNYSLGEIKRQITLDNIHIKYNFIIIPVKMRETFNYEGMGSWPIFVYNRFIDFYRYDNATFDIMMYLPENTDEIYLDYNYLNCETISYASPPIKRCTVQIKNYKYSYGTSYSYIQQIKRNSYSYSYQNFYELSPIQIKLPERNEIVLKINYNDNMDSLKIGTKGVLFFVTNYYDSENKFNYTDIEENTVFNTQVFDQYQNEYNVKCRLWKTRNFKINIICKLNTILSRGIQKLKLKDIIFDYNTYTVYIFSNTYIEINQLDYSLSFLYSDEQYITINNDIKRFYNFTFKSELYNGDKLYLYGENNNYVLFDDCIEDSNKILTCKIHIDKINEILIEEGEHFSVGAMNDYLGIYKFNQILPIYINHSYIEKENIYVTLGDPFGSNTYSHAPFGFYTDKDNIPNIITKKINDYCYFKKVTGMKLLCLCSGNIHGDYYLDIDSHTYYDIHWKYNFIIQNSKYEYFDFKSDSCPDIKLIYPDYLNFYNNDMLIIRYIMSTPSDIQNIRLNQNASNLGCIDLIEMKLCYVSLAHFRSEYADGNYYTYHLIKQEYIKYYGLSPIDIVLPRNDIIELYINQIDNSNIQYLGKDNILYFITNYKDTSNIFDNSQISSFSYNVKLSIRTYSYYNNVINGTCHFWKPINENIRLICKLIIDNYGTNFNNIYFNENIFNYKSYKFAIYSNESILDIKQILYKEISFLYTDNIQVINMNDNNSSYELNFKNEIYYNNNQLMLYKKGDRNKNIGLTCIDKGSEVSCNINKDKLIKILVKSGETFEIYQNMDYYSIIPMNSIFDIIINYKDAQKQEINLEITNLLTPIVDNNSFIVYETNITDIIPITTDYFSIITNRNNMNNKIKCLFKKNSEKTNEKLLLLCFADNPGESYLSNLNREIEDDINILYNFKISFMITERFFITSNTGSIVFSVYPEELDFKKESQYYLRYETDNPSKLGRIKLNINSEYLFCRDYEDYGIKECYIQENYFSQGGEYYTYHENSLGENVTLYEIPTIKVILKNEHSESGPDPEDSDDNLVGIIVGSVIGGLVFIAIIIFLICRFKRKNEGNSTTETSLLKNNVELNQK